MADGLIHALHQLQAVETQLRQARYQLERKRRGLDAHKARLTQLQEQLIAKDAEIRHKQVTSAQLELQFKAKEVNVNKLRQQLNAAKSNKEYSAILTQLNTERADNSKLEDRILQEMSAIDALKEERAKMEENLRAEETKIAELEKQFEAERGQLEDHISQLQARCKEAAGAIPATELSIFERVADRHDGNAMAKMVKPDPRQEEYICDGCNMTIPVDFVNALMIRDEVRQCPICGRILYLEQAVSK